MAEIRECRINIAAEGGCVVLTYCGSGVATSLLELPEGEVPSSA